MVTRKTRCLPTCLEKVQRRFERWRQTRKIPSRIPRSLWASAARVAGTYGLSRTAKALRVNYQVLKQRVDENTAARGEPEKSTAERHRPWIDQALPASAFLELAPPMRVGSCQCVLELEDASGAKMRVHLQGAETPDLTALSHSFWDRGR